MVTFILNGFIQSANVFSLTYRLLHRFRLRLEDILGWVFNDELLLAGHLEDRLQEGVAVANYRIGVSVCRQLVQENLQVVLRNGAQSTMPESHPEIVLQIVSGTLLGCLAPLSGFDGDVTVLDEPAEGGRGIHSLLLQWPNFLFHCLTQNVFSFPLAHLGHVSDDEHGLLADLATCYRVRNIEVVMAVVLAILNCEPPILVAIFRHGDSPGLMDSLHHAFRRDTLELLLNECIDVLTTETKQAAAPAVLSSEANYGKTWFLTTYMVVDPVNGYAETRRNLPRRPKRLDNGTDNTEGKTLNGLIHVTSSAIESVTVSGIKTVWIGVGAR